MSELKFGQVERPEQEKDNDYEEAGERIVKMANKLIDQRHRHLKQARILFLTYDDTISWRGKEVPGRVYKVHDRERVRVKADMEVVISLPKWEQLAEENKQEAALDWLLCFITIGAAPGMFTTQDPSFFGFYQNIDEFGMWDRDLKTLEKKINQQKFKGM